MRNIGQAGEGKGVMEAASEDYEVFSGGFRVKQREVLQTERQWQVGR